MSNGEHQESVLEARGLVKRYPEGRGELQVLNGVELTV
ncbi:MAG TPA: lipoprotein-releasing system ATP-binding protein LolD, partial [Alcanivorax sp.]|nr:lipoprotein-releasing system ATP-binding protein LolD [Alcanivorax sp.]HAD63338.1 lipoprotein-releasing system ATP-binding protein LolD [Alcanivorax sp.]HBP68155.1 lipoprotein-releasing system ATP-binding protein LolD [Alcanivorax sp.]HBT04861.1 lipoprotein-releasing system ATP-binding protein LolD [Alcanivorax sp.]